MHPPLDPDAQRLLECPDREAQLQILAELFMKHRDRLETIVELRLDPRLKRRVGASDVLQETYLDAQRRLMDFLRVLPMPFFVWLRHLATQRLLDLRDFHVKAKVRSLRREVPIDLSSGPEPSTRVMARQLVGPGSTPVERGAAGRAAEADPDGSRRAGEV